MAATEYPLTRADFDRYPWEEAIASAPKKECFAYSIEFRKRLSQAREVNDEVAAALFTVLFVVTDVGLCVGDANEPFGPRFRMSATRGTEPADITGDQFRVLRELAPLVSDPEMRSRLCDLVWTVKRGDHRLPKIAVRAYLESAKILEDPVEWVNCEERIRRATLLARSLGAGGSDEFNLAISYVEDLLARLDGIDSGLLSCRLLQLLRHVKKGDPVRCAAFAQSAAMRAEVVSEFRRARHYWETVAEWYAVAKADDKREAALTAAAETHIKQAEQASSLPLERLPNITAARELQSAVHALRKIGSESARRRADEVYQQLVQYQARSVGELKSVSFPVDLTNLVDCAEEAVGGLSLEESLSRVACLVTPARKADLRRQVEKSFAASRLSGFVSTTKVSNTGKIVATRPHFEMSAEARELAVTAEMHAQAVRHRMFVSQGYLVAAILKIRNEHPVGLDDFYRLAASSSFVPVGREVTVAKGLFAGFMGDLIVSTHLLIPQIEESIRAQLATRGAITSGFTRQNLQNEYDLNTTLYMEEINQLYDEDTVFDLRGLLVEHHGSNLRNSMAHGLLDDGQLQSDSALYLWGLTLKLCLKLLPVDGRSVQSPQPDMLQQDSLGNDGDG